MPELKVTIIPVDAPFLRVLARQLVKNFRSSLPDLSAILIIIPNQRNKFYFRRYLLEESNAPGIIPPVMKTVDEFIETAFEALGGKRGRLLNRIERNFILKQVTDTLQVESWQELDFLRFIAIGNRLLTFFDELAKERLTLDQIEKFVQSGHYPERYVENELPILKDIYDRYRQLLNAQGYQDEIDKFDLVYDRFTYQLLNQYDAVLIAGIGATTAVENRVISEILKKPGSRLVLHSGQQEELRTPELDQPFYLHAKLLAALGKTASPVAVENGTHPEPPVFHIRSTKTDSQETFHLRTILRQLKDRYPPHRIGIVLADETMVDSVIEPLRASSLGYNLSLGFPFTKSLLYSFISSLYSVIETGCHYQEFFAFIKHPLVKNAVIDLLSLRPMVYRLERFMTDERFNYFEPRACVQEELQPLVSLTQTCIAAATAELPFNRYVDGIARLLTTILGYNRELMKTHSAEIGEFFDRLTSLAKLRLPADPIQSGPTMLEFILQVMKTETYNLFGDPMRGVQVIGLLEARNLDFDCIILPAFNEGIFPRKTEKDLFINHEVRRQVGLPYDKERDNLYLYYFTQLCAGKKEVFVSYVLEEKRDVRSRFVDFLIEKGARVDESKVLLERQALECSPREIAKDKPLLDLLYSTITKKGLSPTALRDYTVCPYLFYLRYLLRSREPAGMVEEPTGLEWGGAVHAALKTFYDEDFPEGFRADTLSAAHAQLSLRLEQALRALLARQPKPATFFDLKLWTRRLDRFLDHELKRFEEGFKVDTAKLEKYVDFYLLLRNLKIRLNGFVDRVDRFNNLYYIIDYKTGSLPPTKNYTLGEDFTEFQLPLYGLILAQGDFGKIFDLAYYAVGKNIALHSIRQRLATDIPSYLRRFQDEILIPTLEELVDPSRPFSANRSEATCEYCSFQNLCGT